LSGFTGEDSWLILLGGKSILITDSRYTLQAKKECPICRIYQRKGSMIDAADILKKLAAVKIVAVEDKIQLAIFNLLRKKLPAPPALAFARKRGGGPVRIKPVKNLVESVRAIKDKSEIAAIKKAIEIAERALEKVLPKIRVNMSEAEIAAILEFELKKAGASPSFETVVAFGSNSAMAHHRPTARKLRKIDTILIDYGAKFNGYCCDITRCFAVGKVNNFYAKAYKTVLRAQTDAINVLKAGIEAKKVDEIAKKTIKSSKLLPYGHGLGHGTGLDVHEQPRVSVLSKASLQNGNVITVEPAVYIPGKFGIRIEDNVLITENGCEILSTLLKSEEVPLLKV
ncbi:MAG: Xaa-Pro peptidase family protein, partial [Planctomycetes bacterium]|nr:Xaa-Pro peptidase family protein [Planctomycetota bacterium]